jgi:hypothetical protein
MKKMKKNVLLHSIFEGGAMMKVALTQASSTALLQVFCSIKSPWNSGCLWIFQMSDDAVLFK